MSKVCVMLIGLPGTGKTTFRKTLMAYHMAKAQEPYPAWNSVSSDDLIEYHAKQRGETYNQAFPNYIDEATRVVFGQLKYSIDYGDAVIVVDRTNLTAASRAKIIETVKERDPSYKIIGFSFFCPGSVLMNRLAGRPDKEIPLDVLADMKNRYEPATLAEGFDFLEYVNTTKELRIQNYYNIILNTLEDKPPHSPR